MRINNLYQKIRFAGLLLLAMLIAVPSGAQVKKEKKARQLFDVVLKVTDENGTPIPEASIVVGEGITHAVTDENGSVSVKGYPEDIVTVTAPRYEKVVSNIIDLVQNPDVKLMQAKVHMTSGDDVPLPFTTLKRRRLTGPDLVLPGSYFEKYPSTDLRNTLTGISSMYDVREVDGSPGLSPLEGLQNFSGLGNGYGATDKFSNVPYVLVDNMPAELSEMVLDPGEIESVTLIKGILGTAMFGPAATGGVLNIKTRHGAKNERLLNVDIESGVSVVDRFPGYVNNSADYATLNNLARKNSGLTENYSPTDISNYEQAGPYDLEYPNVDFAGMMLKNTMGFRRVGLSSSGGNDVVQYYSYLGYAGEGDIMKIGAKSDYNRITARQNVVVKINDQINVQFGFYGNLSYRRSPNYGYDSDYTTESTSNAALTLTELPSILGDIHSTPPNAYPVWAKYDKASNTPWYGVTATYNNNLIGNLVDQGFYTDRGRTGSANFALNYDMGNLVKGLKSTTFLGFNILNLVRIGKANDYLAYTATIDPVTGDTTFTKQSSHNLIKMSDMYKLMDYYFQRYSIYEELSYDKTFGNHELHTSATIDQTMTYLNGIEEPQRQRNIVWTGTYSFSDKYTIQAVLNYAGNSSFDKGYRSKLFPVIGANWVISDEGFMSNVKFLNYLKLRAQYGNVGNETYFPNLYYVDRWSNSGSSFFGPISTLTWFGSTQETVGNRTNLSRTGNPVLTWETRKELNAGFDAILMNHKLELDMTYFNWLVDGAITQVSNVLPYLAGYNGARPYYNFGKTRYNALGIDLKYSEDLGDFEYTIGANATTSAGKRIRYDEPNYRFEYQRRTGKASDAIFGLNYLGTFDTDAHAQGDDGTPIQMYDNILYAGDLQYEDMNSDGVVDDNDQVMIGHSSPRLYYGLSLSMKYKNFDLFVLGAGRAFYDLLLNNTYYWSGWGDGNYSNFVSENLGGKYPKLTYYKINNNFLTSQYWLTKGGYFKIQNVELAYTIPATYLQFMGGRAIRIYVRGSNLLTLSKVKDVDPESINSGVTAYPLFRTFSGGVKINF